MENKGGYRVLKRACDMIRKMSPGYLEMSLLRALLNAATPYIAVYMSALIIDELTKDRNLKVLGVYVFISVCGTVFMNIICLFLTKRIHTADSVFVSQVKHFLNCKRNGAEYVTLEDPEYTEAHAKILEIIFMTNGGITAVNNLLSTFVQNVISLVIAFSILGIREDAGDHSFLFLAVTAGVVIFSVFLSMKNTQTVSKKEYDLTQNSSTNKYMDYYHFNYMEDDKAGKDIRIFDQRKLIIEEIWSKGRLPWMNVLLGRYRLYQKYFGRNILIFALVGGYAYISVGLRALKGVISLGSVTRCYSAVTLLVAAINSLFTTVSQIKNNNKYLSDFFAFIDTSKTRHHGTKPMEKLDKEWKIECHNVSFKYPGSKEYALKNVSMTITSDSRTAFVGRNGSGKTTMIKLLCGFYQPEEGTITLNGTNIQEYLYEEYLRFLSVVFQDFKLFSLPVCENIAASHEVNEQKVWDSLKVVGMDERIDQLPLKERQYIYQYVEEDGEGFSGGEEQKLAIARAHYRNAPFVVMDEPTASLDPVSEYEIYSKLNEIAKEKGAVFISHRLSSCKFCDHIFVFDNGTIVQKGDHNSLIDDTTGKYYELWNAQAQYYTL